MEKKERTALKKTASAKTKGITKEMTLGEVVSRYPQAIGVLFKHGMHCIGCHISAFETLEQGALAHGMTEEEISQMIKEMNMAIEGKKEK